MPPRAYWTGNLRISLVSFGVRLHNAVSEAERIRLHQVHKGCNTRVRMPLTCPVHGQLERSEIAKAYEFEKDRHVVIDQAELDAIKLRTEKTIELSRFVPVDTIDPVYLDGSFYVVPDGPIALEPFAIFREALEKTGMAGMGEITVSGRERALVLRPAGKGFVLTTLHAAAEVRAAEPYFAEVGAATGGKENMDLAVSLIKGKAGKFEPAAFSDRYQEALVKLIRSKVDGEAAVIVQEEDAPSTFNFADALRQSLSGMDQPVKASRKAAATTPLARRAGKKKPPARSITPAAKSAGAAKRKRA